MRKSQNKQGFVLIVTLIVVAVVVTLGTVLLTRLGQGTNIIQRQNASLLALNYAIEGLNFAMAEMLISNENNEPRWLTHAADGYPINPEPLVRLNQCYFDSANGLYYREVDGKRLFELKAFSDPDDDNFTIILCKGLASGVEKALMYSATYGTITEYFFYYPGNKDFSGYNLTYDCNGGKIYVNGKITFATGNPTFNDIASLEAKDRIEYHVGRMYDPMESDIEDGVYDGEDDFPREADGRIAVAYRSWYKQFGPYVLSKGATIKPIGVNEEDSIIIPAIMNTAPHADEIIDWSDPNIANLSEETWAWQKYGYGTPRDPAGWNDGSTDFSHIGVHYRVGNEILEEYAYNLSEANLTSGLFLFPGDDGTQAQLDYDNYVAAEDKDVFWTGWKDNHTASLPNEPSPTLVPGWERQFYCNYLDSHIQTDIDGNEDNEMWHQEWWEDLRYGSDRHLLVPGEDLPYPIGFTRSDLMSTAWNKFLSDNELQNIIKAGADEVAVQGLEEEYRDIAIGGGPGKIYINVDSAEFDNPLGSAARCVSFFNTLHSDFDNGPDGEEGTGDEIPKPTTVLEIDVAELPGELLSASEGNLIYVEGEPEFIKGVMLVNATQLPEGGLTLFSKPSAYITGDFNTASTPADLENPEKNPNWRAGILITKGRFYPLSNQFNIDNYQGYEESGEQRIHMPFNYTINPETNERVSFYNPIEDYYFRQNYLDNCGETFEKDGVTYKATVEIGGDIYRVSNPIVTWENIQANLSSGYLTTGDITALNYFGQSEYNTAHDWQKPYKVYGDDNDEVPDTTYNMAVVTPYDPEGYYLEATRKSNIEINGAFIKLPESDKGDVLCWQRIGIGGTPSKAWYQPSDTMYDTYLNRLLCGDLGDKGAPWNDIWFGTPDKTYAYDLNFSHPLKGKTHGPLGIPGNPPGSQGTKLHTWREIDSAWFAALPGFEITAIDLPDDDEEEEKEKKEEDKPRLPPPGPIRF